MYVECKETEGLLQAHPKPEIVPKLLEKNVLQLTCGLFVGFLFVTQSVSLAARSLWKSLQTQCFSRFSLGSL